MILVMSIILGLLGAVGYALAVGDSDTPKGQRRKVWGLWLNLGAQIPWVIFNLATGAWGLFPINVITVFSSARQLLKIQKSKK